jgi:hypothetical protein
MKASHFSSEYCNSLVKLPHSGNSLMRRKISKDLSAPYTFFINETQQAPFFVEIRYRTILEYSTEICTIRSAKELRHLSQQKPIYFVYSQLFEAVKNINVK